MNVHVSPRILLGSATHLVFEVTTNANRRVIPADSAAVLPDIAPLSEPSFLAQSLQRIRQFQRVWHANFVCN